MTFVMLISGFCFSIEEKQPEQSIPIQHELNAIDMEYEVLSSEMGGLRKDALKSEMHVQRYMLENCWVCTGYST